MIGSISGFFDGFSRIAKFAARWDDDFFDRMNHRYSTIILLIFTVIVSTKQYVGEPIVCWCPALFTGAMVEYSHQVCWISNTYYLPPNQAPLTKDQPREQVLVYYQWVPFILLTQAFLFQLTNMFWISMSGRNGLDVNRLVMMIGASENADPELRQKAIKRVIENLDQSIAYSRWKGTHKWLNRLQRFRRSCGLMLCGKGYGNYLTTVYLICKAMYIVNAIGQIYLLNFLLGAEDMGIHFSWFGIQIIQSLLEGKDVSSNTKVFPRVTMCDFTIRQFSNLQDYTIECSLPINLFSEKFFIFLWFWIALMFLANIYSLLAWLCTIFSISQVGYVKKYLKLIEKVNKKELDRKHIACFAEEYLRNDGIFCLRMLASNTNEVVAAQVVAKLWNHYKTHHVDNMEYHKPHTTRNDDSELGLLQGVGRSKKSPTKFTRPETPDAPSSV